MGKVHIVGAGMSGLAAAVKLAEAGRAPMLHEMSGMAGGRCRSYRDRLLGREIDNGNHLILGGNAAALEYVNLIGSGDLFHAPERGRYRFIDAATGDSHEYRLPGAIPGVSPPDWLRLLRLSLAGADSTVAECFAAHSPLFRRLIAPLTLAALNTAPAEASARMLRRVLFETMLRGGQAGRCYLSRLPLSASLAVPAIAYIEAAGGSIRYHRPLTAFESGGGYVRLLRFGAAAENIGEREPVIFALPCHAAARLLPEIPAPGSFSAVLNVHFSWDGGMEEREIPSFLGILNSPLHWIFFKPGMISTTSSAADGIPEFREKTHGELADLIWQEVCKALRMRAPLPPHRVLLEKRATFKATPQNLRRRAGADTPYRNLFLAGDWTDTALPASIESAALSGFAAAERAIRMINAG